MVLFRISLCYVILREATRNGDRTDISRREEPPVRSKSSSFLEGERRGKTEAQGHQT